MCGSYEYEAPSAATIEPKAPAKRKSRAKAVVAKRRKSVKRKAV